MLDRFEHAFAIAHNDDAIDVSATRVTPAENRGAMAHRHEQTRQCRDNGSLATAPDREISNADDPTIEGALRLRMALVPGAPKAGQSAVGRAQDTQWITRNGRTTADV
jgi:hypothetical protein